MITKTILTISTISLLTFSAFASTQHNEDSVTTKKIIVLENKIKSLEKQVNEIKQLNKNAFKTNSEPKFIIERRGSKQLIKVN